MFRIELLPAAHGDAVWIEYGDPRRPRRIVIDGGPAPTYERALRQRILGLRPAERRIDLLIVTHIDCDHIDGSIILLREIQELKVQLGEVWFNGWPQIAPIAAPTYEPMQGEFLEALLKGAGLADRRNIRVKGEALYVPDDGPLPSYELDEGARLTLLAPTRRQINRLRARWQSAIRGFSPGDTAEAMRRLATRREYQPPPLAPVFGARTAGDDRSVANGSSIAFILEYQGVSCLLPADAHPRPLAAALRRFGEARTGERGGRVSLTAVKVPHHGSIGNISEELVTAIGASYWLLSTNGAIFGHPDRETAELIARHAIQPPTFVCNYRTASTEVIAARAGETWQTMYPGQGAQAGPTGGVAIDLGAPAGAPRSRSRVAVPRTSAARVRRRRKRTG